MKHKNWWIYGVFIIIYLIPAYTWTLYDPKDTENVVKEVLTNPLIYQYQLIYRSVKIVFLVVFIITLFSDKIQKLFNYFIAVLLLFTAVFQSMAYTDNYGFVVLIGNLFLILIVSILWVVQGLFPHKNQYRINIRWEKYILIILALFAFYFPVNTEGNQFDFTINQFFFNHSIVTFSMFLPVSLISILFTFKQVNRITLHYSSFIGMIFGIVSLYNWFILFPQRTILGYLHLPLFIISSYVFLITRNNRYENVLLPEGTDEN